MLKSLVDWSGREIAGTILGNPAKDGDYFIWDGNVPEGEINELGQVITTAVGKLEAPELAPDVVPVSLSEKEAGVVRYNMDDLPVDAKGKEVLLEEDTIKLGETNELL